MWLPYEVQHAHSAIALIPRSQDLRFRAIPLNFSRLVCSSVQHMCALASSHAYLSNHHACTKVGHSLSHSTFLGNEAPSSLRQTAHWLKKCRRGLTAMIW